MSRILRSSTCGGSLSWGWGVLWASSREGVRLGGSSVVGPISVSLMGEVPPIPLAPVSSTPTGGWSASRGCIGVDKTSLPSLMKDSACRSKLLCIGEGVSHFVCSGELDLSGVPRLSRGSLGFMQISISSCSLSVKADSSLRNSKMGVFSSRMKYTCSGGILVFRFLVPLLNAELHNF